jgi:RNA polymerase sigma factor (TIGR02999 family)
VRSELRKIAPVASAERRNHTLQPTALINEAYVRLVHMRQPTWQNRAHFFALSAQIMRRILVDFARTRMYQKRGGGAQAVMLDDALLMSKPGRDLVALDDALAALAIVDARKSRVVEMRFFGGRCRGDRASAAGLAEDGHARVANSESVVVEGTDERNRERND